MLHWPLITLIGLKSSLSSGLELLPSRCSANCKSDRVTCFPASLDQTVEVVGFEPKLVQAADLIGQLGDPMYPKKANALFYEFEETGMNRQLGYSSPADLIDKYPGFFWNCVSMHIEEGMKLLNLTVSGRQWIANLHHHILCAERSDRMMGPQLAADRGLKVAGRCELREMRKEVIVVGNLRLSRIAALP